MTINDGNESIKMSLLLWERKAVGALPVWLFLFVPMPGSKLPEHRTSFWVWPCASLHQAAGITNLWYLQLNCLEEETTYYMASTSMKLPGACMVHLT